MIGYFKRHRASFSYRFFSAFLSLTFIFSTLILPFNSYAQVAPQAVLNLPPAGTMISPTTRFAPVMVKGITIYPDNPLRFDFIVDTGDTNFTDSEFREESSKIIKYFLASLTVPDDELWVNLSPYEDDRIIPDTFGATVMGRDLLAQDYLLKQLTASLMYPEEELGKSFWEKIHTKAQKLYGTTEIPVNTFNKVWIVPENAVIYEDGSSAYVVQSHLKVMLEQDYIALQANMNSEERGTSDLAEADVKEISSVSSDVVRELILPEIEKEVNQGKTFANLRQISHAMILATWYKQNLKESLLGQVYVDKNKTVGVDVEDKAVKDKIYNLYLEAFQKGVYNLIKEDYDALSGQVIPRKYFSGGYRHTPAAITTISRNRSVFTSGDRDMVRRGQQPDGQHRLVEVEGVAPGAAADGGLVADLTNRDRRAQPFIPEGGNLAKKVGLIPHRDNGEDGFFSVNRAIQRSSEIHGLESVSGTLIDGLRAYLGEGEVVDALSDQGIDAEDLLKLIEDPDDLDFLVVADTKNRSPSIVMRNANNYQVSHESFRNRRMYHSRELIDRFKAASPEHINPLLLRGLVALAQGMNV